MKPRVVVDARMLLSSGIGTYLRSLLPFLQEEFSLTLLLREEGEDVARSLCVAQSLIVEAPLYSLKEQWVLARKIPPCDLFWSPHYNVPHLPIRALKRAVTIYDLCPLALPSCFPRIKGALFPYQMKRVVQKADLVLTVSEFSKREIQRLLRREEVHVVQGGIGGREEEESLLPPPPPFVLYVGNLKPHKNIRRLVEAFVTLPPSYHLFLVGRNFLGDLPLFHHPRVHLLGQIEDRRLTALYREAELLVQPSLYEGFGLTPLEAMQEGCPVVSSGAGGLLESCGKAAFYVDPLSVESLAEGMSRVLEDEALRESLIVQGKEQVASFSLEEGGRRLNRLFKEVLGR